MAFRILIANSIVGGVARSLLAGLLLLVASQPIAQAQSRSGSDSLPSQSQLAPMGLERAWLGQATLNPGRDTLVHFVIDEDCVYMQSSAGLITAFDADTGRQLWARQLGSFDDPSQAAASNATEVLVAVGVNLFSINKRTGATMWNIRLPAQPSTRPAVDDRHVYIGTMDGSLYAYRLDRIRELYQQQRLPQFTNDAFAWRYRAAKEVTSQPYTDGKIVTFTSRDGSLYAVSTDKGRLLYQFETEAPITAPTAVANKVLYLASEDRTFYAITFQRGTVIWDFASGQPIRKAPFVVGQDLFITPERGGMFCMDTRTGNRRWWQSSLMGFNAVIGDKVFASDDALNLISLDRKSGTILGRLPLRAFPIRIANDRTDRIFVATSAGMVVALRPKNRTLPVFHKYPERQPLMPMFASENPDDDAEAAPTEEPEVN